MTGTGKAHATLIAEACSQYGKSTKSVGKFYTHTMEYCNVLYTSSSWSVLRRWLVPLVYAQHGVATLKV